jgi:hypothetical protein
LFLPLSVHAACCGGSGNLVLLQFDIRAALLNWEEQEEIVIRALAGAEHLAGARGRLLHLRCGLYGLRQVPRAWNKRLEGEIRSRAFVQSNADPSLCVIWRDNGIVLSIFCLNDVLVAARSAAEGDALVELAGPIFEIRALGEPKEFLDIEISCDLAAGTITISQESKALAHAKQLGVTRSRRALPISPEAYVGLRAAHGPWLASWCIGRLWAACIT